MRPSLRRWGLAAWLLVAAGGALAADPDALTLHVDEPRAFGYFVGDVVPRHVVVHVPARLKLDDGSMPVIGGRGRAFELRAVRHRLSGESGGQRLDLWLDYQIFLAPRDVRTLELPTLLLRFQGTPRNEEVRVEAWPVTVAPLVPVEVSPRTGLGDMRPDTPPPHLPTRAHVNRLIAYGVVLAALLAWLGIVYFGLPWWSRRHRPFGEAWRAMRGLSPASAGAQWMLALRQMHEALNRTAGEVLFEPGVPRFLAMRPAYEPLRAELTEFFQRSRRAFFASDGLAANDGAWLLGFCRRCRDIERGAA